MFSQQIEDALATYSSLPEVEGRILLPEENSDDSSHKRSSSIITANAASTMSLECTVRKGKKSGFTMKPIDELDRDHVIGQAERCLAWAHDSARPAIPGAENMTKDQVRRCLLLAKWRAERDRSFGCCVKCLSF